MKVFILITLIIPLSVSALEKTIDIDNKYRQFMTKYCVECHNAKKTKGKTRLDENGFSFTIRTVQDADNWQKILTAVNAKEMPPEDEQQPTSAEKVDFLEMLSGKMVEAREFFRDTGGKVLLRRLNRREYANTVKELLGAGVDVSDLPEDHSVLGYDTDGSTLFMSSDQIEQYLKIAREGVVRVLSPAETAKKRIQPEDSATPALTKRAAQYKTYYENGLAFKSSKDPNKKPGDFDLIDARDAFTSKSEYSKFYGSVKYYLDHPLTKKGFLLGLNRHNQNQSFSIPNEGLFKIRARVGKTKNAPNDRTFLDLGFYSHSQRSFNHIDSFHVTADTAAGQIVETLVEISEIKELAFRERQRPRAASKIYRAHNSKHGRGPDGALWVDWVEWEGPLPYKSSAVLEKIKSNLTSESSIETVKNLLTEFSIEAFRGDKPSKEFIAGLGEVYKKETATGKPPLKAIAEPISMILSSPGFLYLSEPAEDDNSKQISQRELAVRLAYFLWSSPPDKELMDLAVKNELRNSDVLNFQVSRMLKDKRSENFYRDFTYQWLDMERLDFFEFDLSKFPGFGRTLKHYAAEEVYRTVKLIADENLSTENLIKSDFIVINGMLAEHYGIPGVKGDHFRKVRLEKGSVRGGLTAMAAVLAMGSDGNKTSPVERGAWVLRKILNNPPPPAPANVPQLGRIEGLLTARQVLKAHQEEPQCAHCHKKIDPVGFGLENFDPTGKWRTSIRLSDDRETKKKKGSESAKILKVDPSGSFYQGSAFNSYQEFRNILHSKADSFNEGLIREMLSYSLGRPLGFADQNLIKQLQSEMKKQNNTIGSLIQAIVKSAVFSTKK